MLLLLQTSSMQEAAEDGEMLVGGSLVAAAHQGLVQGVLLGYKCTTSCSGSGMVLLVGDKLGGISWVALLIPAVFVRLSSGGNH